MPLLLDVKVKAYKTKVAKWLVFAIVGIVMVSMIPILVCDFSWGIVAITALFLLLVIYFLFDIVYTISGHILTVRCGVLPTASYDINQISKIKDTNTILSAPASSLDRIAIYFTNQKTPLIISPKDKSGFISDLLSINPGIEYCGAAI